MPRIARESVADVVYHIVTRGNRRERVFHVAHDYADFLHLIALANERIEMRVLAFCLMPNHVHLVLQPLADDDVGRWMHWLLTSHVRRHHRRYRTEGRIWQGRYKDFPVQDDRHLLTVLRYVERNPLAASLVRRAIDWPWSSLRLRALWRDDSILTPPPIELGDWLAFVETPLSDAEVEDLAESVRRGRPYGDPRWAAEAATRLGLEFTLRPRGRPRRAAMQATVPQ